MADPQPRDVTLLALDVDGVMTDGSILLDADGREIKRFNVRDGQGIAAWHALGFRSAIITARESPAVLHRARELGITHVVQGARTKGEALDRVLAEAKVQPAAVAYIGDDWRDLPVLRRVGYPIAVADAAAEVRAAARWITPSRGGRGAVREAVEHILRAKSLLDRAVALYDCP